MDVHYTIRQLQYFVAVARVGTMSGAAARCHVSQSALLLGISQLERSLGAKLFVRQRSKGAELTPAGISLLERAEHLLQEAFDLQLHLDVEREGTLIIGCFSSLAPIYMPRLLAGFKREYPGISLEFSERTQPDLLRELRDGVSELALLYDTILEPDIEYIEVEELTPYILLAADHRLAGETAVSLIELAEEPMIQIDIPPSREHWTNAIAGLGIKPLIECSSHNFELVRCLVGRGIGYAALYQRPPIDITYEGLPVVAKPIIENVPTLRVVLGYPSGVGLSARANQFAQYAVEALQAVPSANASS